MQVLELLAPARNAEIGIAAIDCGADAVYIAGPDFGARKAAGNSVEDIARLCEYAHQFGARVFVTFNTIIEDDEIEKAHRQMLNAQDAGADAFIIRDMRILDWKDITLPLHASTQCAIRSPHRAQEFDRAGCGRIILERELSLQEIKQICQAVKCEVECFVHGALCVCYSGECRLSEHIDGRSADKGECIQACRSLYDLVDEDGKVIIRNKALLSLKDYKLLSRLQEMAEAGVSSFKIEGRLKNASYVKNVVREYDIALNEIIARHPDLYCRASYGRVQCKWQPDSDKTFNRGYTQLLFDGKKGSWSSMNAPKSMGERIGKIKSIRNFGNESEVLLEGLDYGIELRNGDGFAFTTYTGSVMGFRGDVCEGRKIQCKSTSGLKPGTVLYRNINSAFERILDTQPCKRELQVDLKIKISGDYRIDIEAISEDGRKIESSFNCDVESAENTERAHEMIREQLSKRSGIYSFCVQQIAIETKGGRLPLLSASTLNGIRRLTASDLDAIECNRTPMLRGERLGSSPLPRTYLGAAVKGAELMRSRYCIRYELNMCPKHHEVKAEKALFLLNNGRRLKLGFDCKACEMTVSEA